MKSRLLLALSLLIVMPFAMAPGPSSYEIPGGGGGAFNHLFTADVDAQAHAIDNLTRLRLKNGSNYDELIAGTLTGNHQITFPDSAGTAALLTDITSANFTGTLPVSKGGTGATSLTASRVLQTSAGGVVEPSAITSTTLAFLDATSSVQTQLDGKLSKTGAQEIDTTINNSTGAYIASVIRLPEIAGDMENYATLLLGDTPRNVNLYMPTDLASTTLVGTGNTQILTNKTLGAGTVASADISMGSNAIHNLKAATVGSDAARLDQCVAGGGALMKDGSVTATGDLNMGSRTVKGLRAAASPGEAVRFEQLLDPATLVLRSGVNALQGDLDMGSVTHKITNLKAATVGSDAARYDQCARPTEVVKTNGTNPMAANLDLGGNRITSVGTAVLGSDAVPLSQITPVESIILADGSHPFTGAQDMGYHKLTGLRPATDPGDAVRYDQLAGGGGTLAVGSGGTGATTFTDGGVLIGNGTAAVASTSAGTTGQVLTSNGAGEDPTFQNAGTGDMLLGTAQTVTAAKTFNDTTLKLAHPSGTGTTTVGADAAATTNRAYRLPALTGILIGSNDNGTIKQGMIDYSATLASNPAWGASKAFFGSTGLIFKGSANAYEGLLTAPALSAADRTWTLPASTGTLATNETTLQNDALETIRGVYTFEEPGELAMASGTYFELPAGTAESLPLIGGLAVKTNAYATNYGSVQAYPGTGSGIVNLVGVQASDTPTNGQVPTYNTGGSITWETPAAVASHTKCLNLESPTSSDDMIFFRVESAITVTSIDCIVSGGTSAAVTVNECNGNAASCTAIEAAITCGTTNTTDSGGVDNASVDTGDWVRVAVGTVTGTVPQLAVCVNYTVN